MKTKKALRKLLILSGDCDGDGEGIYMFYHPVDREYGSWSVSESGDWYTDGWNNNKDMLECVYKGLQLYFKTIGVELK